MACEAAIVASDTAPVKEVMEDGKNGCLVDFFDGAALASNVRDLLADDEKRAKLGEAARRSVVEGYDLHKIALPQQLKWIDRLFDLKAGPVEPFG